MVLGVIKIAYIYKITNRVNNKLYIGKTLYNIEKRWREHLGSSKKNNCKHRPLYYAINKYGKENFSIEVLEKCNNCIASEREQYWIRKFNTYKNGYNATIGGDGTPYINRDKILLLWKENKNLAQIAKLTGHCKDSISDILRSLNISSKEIKIRSLSTVKVNMLNKKGQYIRTFASIREAMRFLGVNPNKTGGHISSVCKGVRKSAYGYKWKYA